MQAEPQYLMIGSGRAARQMQHYFLMLGIPFAMWNRKHPLAKLEIAAKRATHILLLISDDSIENFITTHLQNTQALLIHFSGSLATDLAYGAHPLTAFNENLFTLEQCQRMYFIVDHDAPDFKELLPGLPNQHVRLEKKFKAKYHALCVLSGNFSCMLWQKLFATLETEFNFPVDVANNYLLQQMQNISNNPKGALTGPLVRNDTKTIKKNLAALEQDPFQEVYQSFVACYQKLKVEDVV